MPISRDQSSVGWPWEIVLGGERRRVPSAGLVSSVPASEDEHEDDTENEISLPQIALLEMYHV
jgi:hypothetical protein